MLPHEREARIRAGLPVPFAPQSEVEEWMNRDYQDSWLQDAGFRPGVMHRRAGKVEGEGAQHMVQKQSIVGLNRQSGYNRASTNAAGTETVANNPGGTNANVRIFDITPVPPGEYFMRPISMSFDRIAMESALFTTEMGYPFFAEYRNDETMLGSDIPGAGGTFQVPGDLSQYINHNNPVEKIVVINDSVCDIAIGIDSRPIGTAGTFGTGDGAFVVKAGEANTYPVRAYNFVYAINISPESKDVTAGQCRIQLYSTQDGGKVLLRGGARLDDQIGSTTKPDLNFDPVMP